MEVRCSALLRYAAVPKLGCSRADGAQPGLLQLLSSCQYSAAAVAGQLLPPVLAMLCHPLLLLWPPLNSQPSLSSSPSCALATCWVMRWRTKRPLMRFMWAQVRLWFCHAHAPLCYELPACWQATIGRPPLRLLPALQCRRFCCRCCGRCDCCLCCNAQLLAPCRRCCSAAAAAAPAALSPPAPSYLAAFTHSAPLDCPFPRVQPPPLCRMCWSTS